MPIRIFRSKVASARKNSSRKPLRGDFSSVSGMQQANSAWRRLSSGARNLICICGTDSMYEDDDFGPSIETFYAWTGDDASWTAPMSPTTSLYMSPAAPTRGQRVHFHPERARGNEKEELRGNKTDKFKRLTQTSQSGMVVAQIHEKRCARPQAETSQLYDHVSFLHLTERSSMETTATTTATTTTENPRPMAIGDIPEARRRLMAHYPIWGDGNKSDACPSRLLGSSTSAQALEKTKTKREGHDERMDCADARRAWEATKRRVLYIEEHGSLPDDEREDAEGAPRERRARRRKCWAEEVIRGQETRAVKKRRRNGGWWVRENGILAQLVGSHAISHPKKCSHIITSQSMHVFQRTARADERVIGRRPGLVDIIY
ncbi:hypothetical protein B0F90DRAFT_1754526 [Multifurca ochricompacta]|uniref:Uncharacterized protein n=1 Tax=Multifurca ochricompacta TaxID=376703 RepID=A0AAD4LY80_9AGAM|nr:hypothetical protein B0F90DRAFT_1754526 [Multifurca ochricompacta]